ncbi:hypothetical protein [Mesorhizobium sp. Root172]|uniref:hypothetical protein n=1 Tax=Mesorhizobium sp. Root172 TaxID=1736481 RepID=UPI0006FCC527|nr:hypothetical protein [Mesorhizobium sp. Root172]KRB22702.1 hypothetical protein ASE05_16100 [Mesorhizobium sp. Root172]
MNATEKQDYWTALRDDPSMARVLKKLSMDELRTIARHAWRNPVYMLWQDAETAPRTGFFLAWSPDFPDMVSCWKAEIFHSARIEGTPRHLSANHFTKWMPVPTPDVSVQP